MSKPMFAACGLVLALVAVPVVQAQVTIDLSKITCEQYIGYKIINPDTIAMWLSGYYNGQRGNTLIDTETLLDGDENTHVGVLLSIRSDPY